jgi:hypothetical protein
LLKMQGIRRQLQVSASIGELHLCPLKGCILTVGYRKSRKTKMPKALN